ncbi:MAG: Outer membrane protein romA [candidate division TM6 bacterium GW2011_GWF2_38_10]|nr:MAG: Outer membrane protein romA [candidate division TM6 bacterium GW2011_GWF2_38_10]
MKPLRWCGRYYNNKHDSIAWRIKNFTASLFYLAGHHAKKLFLRNAHTHGQTTTVTTTTYQPISNSTTPAITWLGHSSFLIQIAGLNIIADPMFFEKNPLFKRRIPFPLNINALPKIDVVIVSHNHTDHLDTKSLHAIDHHNPHILVPMGNKSWLEKKGFTHVTEYMWQDIFSIQTPTQQDPVTFTFLPASHWTSRGIFDINKTLWGSWLIKTTSHTIYFAGDTAYDDHFKKIYHQYGAPDIVLMPIGPNEPRRFIYEAHVNAQEAVQAFIELSGRHFIPMHWGTFTRMGAEQHTQQYNKLISAWQNNQTKLQNASLHICDCGFTLHIKD